MTEIGKLFTRPLCSEIGLLQAKRKLCIIRKVLGSAEKDKKDNESSSSEHANPSPRGSAGTSLCGFPKPFDVI